MTKVSESYVRNGIQSDDDIDIDLWKTAQFLWHVRVWIVAGFVIGALIGTLAPRLMPSVYEASALVGIVRPPAVSDMSPDALTTKNVVDIAVSGYVRTKLAQELEKTGIIRPGERLGTLNAADYPLLSALALAVQSDSAERAQAVANGWATVLITEAARADALGPPVAASFVMTEFPKASAELAEANAKRNAELARQAATVAELEAHSGLAVKEAQFEALRSELVEVERRAALSGDGGAAARSSQDVQRRLAAIAGEASSAKLAIEKLRRTQQIEMAPFDVAVDRAESRLEKLEESLGDAQIALAQGRTRLTITAQASLPARPVERRVIVYVGIGAVLGAIAALAAAWVRAHDRYSKG